MATNDRLEVARRTGSLANVIGAMRENAATEAPASGRPQMNEIDGAIALAAHLAETGTKQGPERRAAMKDVRPGMTVSDRGVEKTRSTRAEKIARVQVWAATLTEAQRDEYVQGEKFEALTDRQQELIAEAFGTIDTQVTNIAAEDFNWEGSSIDIDQLPEDETESVGDSFEVLEGEDVQSFDIDDAAPWPGDVV